MSKARKQIPVEAIDAAPPSGLSGDVFLKRWWTLAGATATVLATVLGAYYEIKSDIKVIDERLRAQLEAQHIEMEKMKVEERAQIDALRAEQQKANAEISNRLDTIRNWLKDPRTFPGELRKVEHEAAGGPAPAAGSPSRVRAELEAAARSLRTGN